MPERIRLTDAASLGLRPEPGRAQTIYWDEDLTGFGARVSPKGKVVYFVQYRDKLGRQAKHTIGEAGVVKAAKARDKATRALAEVHLGGNPQGVLRDQQVSDRVIDVAEAYLAVAETRLKPRSYAEVKRTLRKTAKALHQHKAGVVTRAEIAALVAKVATGSGPYAANRARAHLSALWTWALKQGRVEGANPVALTNVATKETPRDRVLSDAELALIWQCTGTGHDHDRIVRLLMLTGARREEVGGLAWAELGALTPAGERLWTLPAARAKNGLPHEVALGLLAVAQLPELRKVEKCEGRFGDEVTVRAGRVGSAHPLVFGRPAASLVGFSGWSKCKARLDGRMATARAKAFVEAHNRQPRADEAPPIDWRLHDLRRTFSTWANEGGLEPHVVEAVLNHVSGSARRGVSGVYNRAVYRVQKRAALSAWADHLSDVCRAVEGVVPSRVNGA